MPLDLSRIRAICFDLDGTLSDTDDQFVLRLARWIQPARFLYPRRDPQMLARWLIMRSEGAATFLYGLPDRFHLDETFSRIGDRLYRLGWTGRPHQFQLMDGVGEMLAGLSQRYPLAIVSARGERGIRAFLSEFTLDERFHCVACAQTCRRTKPYPDPILWAAEQMGVRPEECLMVGDTTVDIRAGKAAGAQTVGVLCGFGEEAELRRAGADLILPHTKDLVSVLNNGFSG